MWMCQLCSSQQPPFSERGEFELHLIASHGNLTQTQRIAHTKRSKTKALRDRWVCPLCECVPPKLSKINPQEQDEEARTLFERHVGSHTKALSLYSFRFLPSRDEGDDTSGNPSDGNVSVEALLPDIDQQNSREESHKASSGGPGSDLFQDIPMTDRIYEEPATRNDEDLEPPKLSKFESWDFVPNFQHLQTTEASLSGNTSDPPAYHPRPAYIAVVGETGVGKSTFIREITGQELRIGHELEDCMYPLSEALPNTGGDEFSLMNQTRY